MTDDLPEKKSDIIMYQTESGDTRLEVRLEDSTVWLSQKMMASLYQKDVRTINEHIKLIFSEGELDPEATIRNFRIVQKEGEREVTRQIDYYNLEMILAVGYRVKSHRGTQFRRWATERLREYLVKGFTMDDERLKEGRGLGADYFDELLER
ncbi:MAG TPA: RhuM family protein, partial [Anaerolineaceae bacterium]|nr:RhuM family protein [Anaerolineaceae bacterium]